MDCLNNNTAASALVEMKIKDITNDKLNKAILHRLKNNDRSFKNLNVRISGAIDRRSHEYIPKTAGEWTWLGSFLGNNTSLRTINIVGSYEQRINLPKYTEDFFQRLKPNKSIRAFELCGISHSNIKPFKLLSFFLRENPNLVDITLESCSVDEVTANLFSSSLKNSVARSLTSFGLRGCTMSDESFTEILEAVSQQGCTLERLDINNSRDIYGRNKYIKLAEVIRKSFPVLKYLCLNNNSVDDVSCVALSDAIANKRGLCTLDLRGNTIGNRGATSLAIALANSDMLQELFLGRNRIGNEGVEALLQALGVKKDLQWLDLSTNEITSLGGLHLLTTNGTNFESSQSLDLEGNAITSLDGCQVSFIENIHLCHNNIDDVGIITFVDALKSNTTLRSLDLSGNRRVSTEGWKSLSALFCSTISRFEFLYLSDNNIDDEVAVCFADALTNNCTLKILELRGNNITAAGWEAFSNVVFNQSSVKSTYYSNHILWSVGYIPDEPWSSTMRLGLKMNLDTNKEYVAIKKILHHHEDISMLPFFKWDLKMLPLMIKWLETAADIPMDFETFIDKRKLSAIFQFVQNVSWLCTM